MSLLELFGQRVFSAGGIDYLWEHVILAAKLWGDWAQLEEEVRQGVACARLAEAHRWSAKAEIDAAAKAFRYERDLISAEEAETWLESWGLTVSEWLGYLRRSLARKKWLGEVAEIDVARASAHEVDSLIGGEAILSGKLAYFARKLAARAAIHAKVDEESESGTNAGRPDNTSQSAPVASPVIDQECLLPGIDPKSCCAIAELLAALDRAFAHFSATVRTARTVEEQVRSHYLGWIRLRCRYVCFPEEEMAREAAHCVRQDGMQLDAVALEAKAYLEEGSFYLEQLEPELSSQLVGARKGDFLGPIAFQGLPTLFLVLDKILPSTADSELRYKSEQAALQTAIELEVADRVKWFRHL